MTATRNKPDRQKSPAQLVSKYRWWFTGAGALVGAVVLLVILWPTTQARVLPPTRARQYTAFQACLLTGAQGLADPAARSVWAGMQDASLATHAKVSYLAVTGPQTAGNAEPFANALVTRHCSLVVGVGKSQVDAVESTAKTNPHTHFAVVGEQGSANVTAIAATGTATRSPIDTLVTNLAK